MDRLNTTHAANTGSKKGNYLNSTENQRQQILDWLRREPLTTLQARHYLDIMHPAARVQELRGQGHNIITHWTSDDSGKARHRVACYVLLAGLI